MTQGPTPQIQMLSGIAPLMDDYDGLILDLWGVIHDGRTPYPGVTNTLEKVRDAGRKVVMLSNAPRRAQAVIDAMTDMGIDRGLYTDVLSSGELAWRALHDRTEDWAAALGHSCLHVGPERDLGLMDGLDLDVVSAPEQGAFILNTGPWRDEEQVSDYEDVLVTAHNCGMPMICANPDIEVIRAGNRIICAGALASRYIELGGDVRYFGKPFAQAYTSCLGIMAIKETSRLLAIGDSLTTDIRGAAGAGVDSVLVTSGIHASELGLAYGEMADPDLLAAACRRVGVFPLAAVPAFVW